MVLDELALPTGVSATLLVDQDGRYAVDITDPTLGDTTVSGFSCEFDARTFLYLGDFDDCCDNAAYLTAGLTGLRWS